MPLVPAQNQTEAKSLKKLTPNNKQHQVSVWTSVMQVRVSSVEAKSGCWFLCVRESGFLGLEQAEPETLPLQFHCLGARGGLGVQSGPAAQARGHLSRSRMHVK